MKKFYENLFIIEGILMGILGILFFVYPIDSFSIFIKIGSVILFIVGILIILRGYNDKLNVFSIINGIITIIFSIVLCFSPIKSIKVLIILYGLWALIRGLYFLIVSYKVKRIGLNYFTIYSIILNILGLLIIFEPFTLLISTPYLIGTYFIFTAISEIYIGFQV